MNSNTDIYEDETIHDLPEVPTAPVLHPVAAYKQQDKELYDKWAASKSKQDMANLLKSLNPLIMREVNKQSGSLPKNVLEAEAKKWAIEAIKRYNPSAGAALSTWVTSYLQKLNRINYNNQNMVRLSEEWQRKFRPYNDAQQRLRDELNREPTDHELASELGWKPTHIKKFKNMLYEDHYESANAAPVAAHKFDFEKTKFDYIMGHLDEQEKHIMKSLMKPDGKRQSASELAGELGVNQNRLSYLKTRMKKEIRTLQNELGEWD